MAIYNISYKSKEIDKLINEELGEAYSLFNKLHATVNAHDILSFITSP